MTWDSSKVKTQERVEAARDSSRYLKEDQGKELCEKKSKDGHSDESLLDHELLFSLVFHTVSGKTI